MLIGYKATPQHQLCLVTSCFNPLILKMTKSSQTILMKSYMRLSIVCNIFEREMLIRTLYKQLFTSRKSYSLVRSYCHNCHWSGQQLVEDIKALTLMLLVANLSITKLGKQPEKCLKHWHMGTHLRVLSESYPMNTNMPGFR